MEIKTVYDLKDAHLKKHPDSYYFSKDTLQFFGEKMSEMKLSRKKEVVKDFLGNDHTCYVLSKYQRNHPCGARWNNAYFDQDTLEVIFKEG